MISDQLKWVQQTLGDWAIKNGGLAFVASDRVHLWELAYQASSKLRVIICYMGETVRGDFPLAAILHRVDREFSVVVTRGRGFAAPRGETLVETVGNNLPLFQLVEEARDLIRAMIGVSVELPVDFKGIKNAEPPGMIIDAYEIEFSLATDLGAVVASPTDMTAIGTLYG